MYDFFYNINYFQRINNITRKYHDAILRCAVYNDVGKTEETETLEITCKFQRLPVIIYLFKQCFVSLLLTITLVIHIQEKHAPPGQVALVKQYR